MDSGSAEFDAGWSSPVARWAHNPKVAGSNPAPATKLIADFRLPIVDFENLGFVKSAIGNPQWAMLIGGVAQLAEHMVCNHGVRGSNPLTSTNCFRPGACQPALLRLATEANPAAHE